jgi:3'-5' exoribonuclease
MVGSRRCNATLNTLSVERFVEKRYIRDLREKEVVSSIFLALDKATGSDRNGKTFLSVNLGDATGQINGRAFDKVTEHADQFESGDVVRVKGFVQVFQGRKQIILHDIAKAESSEVSMKELVANLGGDPAKNLAELIRISETLQDVHIKQIMLATLSHADVKDVVLKTPAAKTIHHAYLGGLLEHILSIVRVMESLAQHYTFLNRDLLLFGAVFHDLGKVWELSVTDGIRYTDRGRLVGHMVLACEWLDKVAASVPGVPQETLDVLKHIILSHHGKLEYGSPKLPMLPEAVVVAMIDDLDSKLNTIYHFMKSSIEGAARPESWTQYNPQFERYFYLPYFKK